MALYGKKLHIRKNGVVTDINLWTESWEAGTPALHIRDGVNLVHAQLGAVTGGMASDLRVRKDNVVYAVMKNYHVLMEIIETPNQTIIVTVNGVEHTSSIGIPYGSSFSVRVVADAGFNPGSPSVLSGVATGDITISATPATQSLAPGSVGCNNGVFEMEIPAGVTVMKFDCFDSGCYWIGVTAEKVYKFVCKLYARYEDHAVFIAVTNRSSGGSLVLVDDRPDQFETWEPLNFKLSWGPEINAHGPTDGSLA